MMLGDDQVTPVRLTFWFIGICIAAFISQMLIPGFEELFVLMPTEATGGAVWQFVTYMFLHGDIFHLFINMFVLFFFGPVVERSLGFRKFMVLFLGSGIGSAFFHVLLSGVSDIGMLGASGAIFGILTAYGFLYPRNWIIMFPGIPMPAFAAVFVFAFIELFFGVISIGGGFDSIAHFGHLGGIIAGVIFMLFYRFFRRRRKGSAGDFEWFWE